MKPRYYQTNAVNELYEWIRQNKGGNPVLNLPGGAGKSVIIAMISSDAIKNFPDIRILMLVHSKELVSQNAEKLKLVYPDAPLGIYSASLKKREIGKPILYAGIQSVRNRAVEIGHIDICMIDEVHSVNDKETGGYRKLLSALSLINPDMRIIGLSASPYRMGSGLITEGDTALFSDIIDPITVEELMNDGYLCKLKSKHTKERISTEGLHRRDGDYIKKELAEKIDIEDSNRSVVREMISYSEGRESVLVYCVSIDHALHITEFLKEFGEIADYVTSKDTDTIRDNKIIDFKEKKIRFLCNVGILTTGFDFAGIDCIAMIRPTASPGLYSQICFRGTRPIYADGFDLETKEGRLSAIAASVKPECLVLDFCGNVEVHGPITDVRIPGRKSDEPGIPPSKICPECDSIVAAQCRVCPDCGNVFDIQKQLKEWKLHHDDIMGLLPKELEVGSWSWSKQVSKKSGIEMLMVKYYGTAISDNPISEYLCVMHSGYAGHRGMETLRIIAKESGVDIMKYGNLEELCVAMTASCKPDMIEYKKDGRYDRIVNRAWSEIPF